jgi:hypothetical protein
VYQRACREFKQWVCDCVRTLAVLACPPSPLPAWLVLMCRIDMDTSGVLVAAKDSQTASLVAAQFRTKQVSKAYLALCLGVPQQQAFTLDGPIDQHPAVKVARCVAAGGQPAATHVQVCQGGSLLFANRQLKSDPLVTAPPSFQPRSVVRSRKWVEVARCDSDSHALYRDCRCWQSAAHAPKTRPAIGVLQLLLTRLRA